MSAAKTDPGQTPAGAALRKRAEEQAGAIDRPSSANQTPEEARRALHELRVHQIELEMQNEELRRMQGALEALKARYFDLYDLAPVGYCVVSEQGLILEANLTAGTILGEEKRALVKKPITRFILPEDQDLYYRRRKSLFETGKPQECELRMLKPDGAFFWAHLTATAARSEKGAPVCRLVLNDITESKRKEDALRESELKLQMTIDEAPICVSMVGLDKKFLKCNRAFCSFLGYDEEEMKQKTIADITFAEDAEIGMADLRAITAGEKKSSIVQKRYVRKDGAVVWGEVTINLIKNSQGQPMYFLPIIQDITERKKNEKIVQASLKEKEILLQEIHHRVKNNMQVISSLMNLQAESVTDKDARRFLKEGQLRIRAIAYVHEKLYHSRDFSRIDFADYVRSLVDHLFHFFQIGTGHIRLESELDEVDLDITTAVPCGILLTELLTNALKYAFPAGRDGVLEVRLQRKKDGTLVLRVADDGVGFPDSVDIHQAQSFGFQIINALIGQLNGTIELDRKNGTAFTVIFREPENK